VYNSTTAKRYVSARKGDPRVGVKAAAKANTRVMSASEKM